MRSTSDVIFNVTGQSLLLRCPLGRPTAATFSVFAEEIDDNGTAEFSGTATVDGVNTTIDASAGTGQTNRTTLSLATGGGTSVVVGRRYLLEQNGLKEWALVTVANGDDLVVSAPLQNAYTTGATFKGTHVSALIDPDWVIDANNLSDIATPAPDYRMRFSISVNSTTWVTYLYFDLVRGAVHHGITLHDVESRFWNLLDDTPADHRADQGARLIDASWEDVKADLAASDINDAALRDGQLVDQLLVKRIRLAFAENGRRPADMSAEGFLDYAMKDYQRFIEKHFLLSSRIAMARGTGGSVTQASAARYLRK